MVPETLEGRYPLGWETRHASMGLFGFLKQQYQHPVLLLPLTAHVLLSAGAGDGAGTGFHSLVSSRLRVRSTYLRTYG